MTTTKGCEECDGKGWVHCESPFEIQRHDACNTFKNDEEAKHAHVLDCGCDWPPTDFQSAFTSWMDIPRGELPLDVAHQIDTVDLLAERSSFIRNLPALHHELGKTIRLVIDHPGDKPWIKKVLENLRGAGGILLSVAFLVNSRQWKDHWTGSEEEGTYDDKTGRWFAPRKERSNG